VWNVSTYEHCTSLPTQNHWVRALVVKGNLLYSGSYKAIKVCSYFYELDIVTVSGYI